MNFYLHDIITQPQEISNFLCRYTDGEMRGRLEQLKKMNIRKIVFSGMGSSNFCALSANLLLRKYGVESDVISTGELLYYEQELLDADTVLCLISQSGESGEIVHLLECLKSSVKIIGVTNNSASTLAKRSDLLFELFVSDEISVTTRTYLASYAVTMLIAYTVLGQDVQERAVQIKEIISGMEDYLKDYETKADQLLRFCRPMNYLCLIGRGYSLTTVKAGALFFREVARFPALDFDGAEFRHGPMELVDDGFYGIVLAPSGPTKELSIRLAQDIAKSGGHVVLITDEPSGDTDKDGMMVACLPKLPEELAALVQILPIQLLANAIAQDRDIPAGEFRWGSKITKEV